jgi:hypothetical protein
MRFQKKERKSLIIEIRNDYSDSIFIKTAPGNPVLWRGIKRASAKGGK